MAAPMLVGLIVCEEVGGDPASGRFHISDGFTETMHVEEFPGSPAPFHLFCSVTDWHGLSDFVVEIEGGDPDSVVVYRGNNRSRGPGHLRVADLNFRIEECVFPAPGRYVFTIWADGEPLAQRTLNVLSPGEDP